MSNYRKGSASDNVKTQLWRRTPANGAQFEAMRKRSGQKRISGVVVGVDIQRVPEVTRFPTSRLVGSHLNAGTTCFNAILSALCAM